MKAEANEADDKPGAMTRTGIAEESKEHPWLSAAQVKHLVADHIAMDPEYYEDDEDDDE
jgi:hypothetical protein